MCDIVGDLAVHTLQPTWETELRKFIYKSSRCEFWVLELRISICTFRKRLSMPSPPRIPLIMRETRNTIRVCSQQGCRTCFCNPSPPPTTQPHPHRPATHVKARSGQNQILQLFKLESCPDTKTQHTGRAWGNARFYFRSVSRDNIKKATKVNQWPAAESPEANLQVIMYQTTAPKC